MRVGSIVSLVCFIVVVLAGGVFASSNVGEIDYYRVDTGIMDTNATYCDDIITTYSGNATTDEDSRNKILEACQMYPLLRKYEKTRQAAIDEGQVFSINLSVCNAGDFRETGKKGEIAIVARVVDQGVSGTGLQFGSSAADTGRLIYFSNDVYEKQNHNLSYIPIYGPLSYSGKSVGIQIYVFEMDEDIKQIQPVISALASAGQALYPPASPVLGLLDTLGSTLLKAARNDKSFEYTFCLWPKSPDLKGYQVGEYPILEAGHYVLMRREDRKSTVDRIPELYLDLRDHRLKRITKKGFEVYKDDAYLVLHIKREQADLAMDNENRLYQSFGDFKTTEASTKKKHVEQFAGELTRLGQEFVKGKNISDIKGLYEKVVGADASNEVAVRENAADLLSLLKQQAKGRTDCPNGQVCNDVLSEAEIEEILARMNSSKNFAGMTAELTYDKLKTGDSAWISGIVNKVVENINK